MQKSTKFIWIVLVILTVLVMWFKRQMDNTSYALSDAPAAPAIPVEKPATTTTVVGQPTFTWSFRKTPGGDIAMTEITLTAVYPNGTNRSQIIETVDGSCNDVDASDKDAYVKSKMAVCYYSGLGINYKIVKDARGEYAVMRKEFEEANPDYNPPVQGYKEVKRF